MWMDYTELSSSNLDASGNVRSTTGNDYIYHWQSLSYITKFLSRKLSEN